MAAITQARLRTPLLAGTILEEERDLETRAARDGVLRYREQAAEAVRRGDGANLKPAERLRLHWFGLYRQAIREEREACELGRSGPDRHFTASILEKLEPDRVAVAAMHEALSLCMAEPGGVKNSHLARCIGRAVIAEINLDILAKSHKAAYRELNRMLRCRVTPKKANWWARRKVQDEAVSMVGTGRVGARLLHMLMEVATCADHDQPFVAAFVRETRYEGVKTVGYTRLSDEAQTLIDDGHAARQYLRPRYLPMLVVPCLWDQGIGGYHFIRTPYIAKVKPAQKKALEKADLSTVNDCLFALGATGWRLNHRVLAVQKVLYEDGGGELGIPQKDETPFPPRVAGDDPNRIAEAKRARGAIYRANIADRAERRGFLRMHMVADLMADKPQFFYPHQFDFRGRAYPIPTHLNHQGADPARGLLEFAEARDAADSRDELYIEAANCYGLDKVPFRDRIAWAKDHERQILASAKDPIGTEFWRHADEGREGACDGKPWQFLAACMAIADPAKAAHLPVKRDGTCNGLQHYAALGRDPEEARLVNLAPGDKPEDVYGEVVGPSRRRVEADCQSDQALEYTVWTEDRQRVTRQIALSKLAGSILPLVRRPVCKQPIMTSVYGVTASGATRQILEKLKSLGLKEEALYRASQYLERVVNGSLGEVCQSTRGLMDWLKASARAVAHTGRCVEWTTPIGFPVAQTYRKYHTRRIETAIGELTLPTCDDWLPVATQKEAQAFPPNFIHSLDATHMLLTARACLDEGLAFASTHDCYWTHAATTARMGRLAREQFVALHERPLLHTLAAQLRALAPDADLAEPPPQGSFDIRQVLDSPYFFS